MQRSAAGAERIIEILTGAGSVAVERNGEAVDAQFSHNWLQCKTSGVASKGGCSQNWPPYKTRLRNNGFGLESLS